MSGGAAREGLGREVGGGGGGGFIGAHSVVTCDDV